MGNLGRYQDIVTEAKLAGGVDAWIEILEDAAAAAGSSKSFVKGVGVGVLVACVVGGGALSARDLLVQKRDRRALADEAREQLRAEIERVATPDAVGGENSSDGTGSAGEKHE